MTRALLSLCLLLSLISCAPAPLRPHDSALGTAGEVIGRTLLCPITFCLSEVGIAQNYRAEQERQAYHQWFYALSKEEQAIERDREERRANAAMQALGFALSGGGPFSRPSVAAPTIRPIQSCTSQVIGTQVYTNCR